MQTIRETISEFRKSENGRTGYTSDDTALSDQYIYSMLNQARARYYKQKMANNQSFSAQSVQSLNCIELVEADKSQCPSTPPSGCIWLESTCELPTFIKVRSVTNDIGSDNYSYIAWNRAGSIGKSRVKASRDAKYYTYKNTSEGVKFYILNNEYMRFASMEVIGDSPLEVLEFCNGESCKPMEEYMFSTRSEIEVIIKMAVDSYMRLIQRATPDIMNDDTPLR